MSTQTILHKESPLVAAFTEAGAGLADKQMVNHYVSNWTLEDVQKRSDLDPELVSVCIDPDTPENESEQPAAIVFDPSAEAIQHLSTSNYHKLRVQQAGLFNPPIVEPDPEPRYRTSMTSLEFVEHIGEDLENAIYGLAQSNIDVQKWKDRMFGAEKVSTTDSRTLAGLQVLLDAEIITSTEEYDRIVRGLLIA